MANANRKNSSISRRAAMFGLAAIAPVGPIVAAAQKANPDAALIALCDKFTRLDIELRARIEGTSDADGDAIYEHYRARAEPIMHQVNGMIATTLEGAKAKARAIAQFNGDLLKESSYWDEGMVASLLRDLVGGAV